MKLWFAVVFLFSFFLNFSQSEIKFKEKPSWVKTIDANYKVSLPKSEISNGSYYLFYDEQYNFPKHSKYYHYAYKIISDLGVQNNSELVFNYNPTYEKFYFNSIWVIRNGERINYKNLVKISTAQREQNLEYSQIDASLSVIVIFQGVRTGDIIEYDYIQEGINPIFSNKDNIKLYFNSDARLLSIYYRVIVDTLSGFRLKYQNKVYLPTKSTAIKSVKDIEWSYTNVEKITAEDHYPESFSPYSVAEITQYKSWEEVEKWAHQLFNLSANPSSELTKKIEELTANKNTEEEKILSIIRFVQDEIRYFGIEIGVNSHLPQKPSITFNRRFGDCKDKSVLMCHMLNGIGIKAYPVLIGTNLNQGLEKYLPSPHLFNHVIVYFYFAGKKYFIDATISNQRGNLDYNYCPNYQKGLIIDNDSFGLNDIISNDYSSIVVKEEYHVKSYTDTNVIFTVKTEFAGDEADNTRAYFLNTSLDDIHTNYLNFYNTYNSKIEFVDSLKYEDDIVKNIFTVYEKYKIGDFWKKDDSLKNKKIKISFYADNISTFLNRYNTNKSKRTYPIALSFPIHYKQHTIINLPTSWSLDYDNQEIKTDYLLYSFSPTTKGTVVNLNWELKTLKNIVPVEDYPDFIKTLVTIKKYVGYEFTKDLSLDDSETSEKKGLNINWLTVYYCIFLFLLFSFLLTKLYVAKLAHDAVLESQTINAEAIGGWLILAIIGLVVAPFIYLYNLFSTNNFSQSTWNAFSLSGFGIWKFVIIFQITFITLFICGTVFLSILFFNRDKRLPKYIIIYYCMTIFYNLCEVLFYLLLDSNERDGIEEELKILIRSIIGGAIWIPYFILSARVKRTFLK
jgi:hypothetical protein